VPFVLAAYRGLPAVTLATQEIDFQYNNINNQIDATITVY